MIDDEKGKCIIKRDGRRCVLSIIVINIYKYISKYILSSFFQDFIPMLISCSHLKTIYEVTIVINIIVMHIY